MGNFGLSAEFIVQFVKFLKIVHISEVRSPTFFVKQFFLSFSGIKQSLGHPWLGGFTGFVLLTLFKGETVQKNVI